MSIDSIYEKFLEDEEAAKSEWMETLKIAGPINIFLQKYNSSSVAPFYEYYLRQKYYWHLNAKNNAEARENSELRWINKAFDHLEIIMQKKLFDLQCLWRAEQVEVKGVEICTDFQVWELNILNCPFVEPLNQSDIELYKQYLLVCDLDFEEQNDFGFSWQDYDEIINYTKTDGEDGYFPEWYDFHNGRTGNSSFLILPNLRGDKEEFYMALSRAHTQDLNKEKQEEEENKSDNRPYLVNYTDNAFMKDFVYNYENKQVQRMYEDHHFKNQYEDVKEDLTYCINELLTAGETIPIEANSNWADGIKKAVHNYKCRKIAQALPDALSEYQMNIQMGISFPTKNNVYVYIRSFNAVAILKGRLLNNEPQNFLF